MATFYMLYISDRVHFFLDIAQKMTYLGITKIKNGFNRFRRKRWP